VRRHWCAGVTAQTVVALTTAMPVAAAPPKVTAMAPVKWASVMVTEVARPGPGSARRRHRDIDNSGRVRRRQRRDGGGPIGIEARPGPGSARRRHREIVTPAACAGVTAQTVVALTTAMPVAAAPPKATAIAPVKRASVMVTEDVTEV